MDFDMEYYTPSGKASLLSVDGVKALVATGIAGGAVYGIAKTVGTESKQAASGALDSLQSEF